MTARTEEVGPSGLASALVASGALQSDWLPTYKAVPRDVFVPDRIWPGIADGTRQNPVVDRTQDPDAWLRAVYSDVPLTTQWDDGSHSGDGLGKTPSSSSSQPHMVFSMLADLDVQDGHRVLEIGTGTGWNSALLAHRLGADSVVSIEFDPEVARGAGENHRSAGIQEWPANGTRSTTTLSPAEVGGWVEQFAIGLQMPGVFWSVERYDDSTYTLWTYSTDTLSWASADYEPGADSFDVVQSGPRRLWDETEAAHLWWDVQGRPEFDRFGLTVDSDGERAWLDSPDRPVPAVG
ncbi:protein-L-isoaspartate(D-aspartate) O-methyltransferase [Streptomyces sp. NPDC051366]|uniref:protein-L-isoaspartate(D-aspartate) O-methyltransferase n=1 Tax=Streptomyces sp. NPDC051366 TaxID=3365652 RepID=UPI0037BD0205